MTPKNDENSNKLKLFDKIRIGQTIMKKKLYYTRNYIKIN